MSNLYSIKQRNEFEIYNAGWKEEVGLGHLCRYDNYVRNREKFTGGKQQYFPFLRLRAKAIN